MTLFQVKLDGNYHRYNGVRQVSVGPIGRADETGSRWKTGAAPATVRSGAMRQGFATSHCPLGGKARSRETEPGDRPDTDVRGSAFDPYLACRGDAITQPLCR